MSIRAGAFFELVGGGARMHGGGRSDGILSLINETNAATDLKVGRSPKKLRHSKISLVLRSQIQKS